VREPGPGAVDAGLDDLRVVAGDVRVEQDAGTDAVAVEALGRAPDADADAVVTPAVVERVRHEVGGAGPDAGGRAVEQEVLDVQPDVGGDPRAARPPDGRAFGDGAVVEGRVLHAGTVRANIDVRFKSDVLELGCGSGSWRGAPG
jgi:hypothetical protein